MKKTLVVASIVLNILLLAVLAIYQFSAYFDFVVINKSVERVCSFDFASEYPMCELWESEQGFI